MTTEDPSTVEDRSADGPSSTIHVSPKQEQCKHPATVEHTATWFMPVQWDTAQL